MDPLVVGFGALMNPKDWRLVVDEDVVDDFLIFQDVVEVDVVDEDVVELDVVDDVDVTDQGVTRLDELPDIDDVIPNDDAVAIPSVGDGNVGRPVKLLGGKVGKYVGHVVLSGG